MSECGRAAASCSSPERELREAATFCWENGITHTVCKAEIRRLEKELAAMQKRSAELDAIFKKLYEDRALERITVEQFQMLSDGYNEERARLAQPTFLKRKPISND